MSHSINLSPAQSGALLCRVARRATGRPHSSYNRLSRYDCTGLALLLQGKEVIALTADTATIRNPAMGSLTTYRRFNKPALGPLGNSLDDLK